MKPAAHRAVMASRREAPDSLDLFCTPPWATRALLEHVIGADKRNQTVWEPASGKGHMALVLGEFFGRVYSSDVHDYGLIGQRVGSFVGVGPDVIETPAEAPDWVITNPPFNKAVEFALRALGEAQIGVALLVRSAWLEGGERFRDVFSRMPPTRIGQFAERVPMVAGRWDPDASTATAYCWVVWRKPLDGNTRLVWIPPGCRDRLTRSDDRERFAGPPIPVVPDDGLIVPGHPALDGWAWA